MMRSFPDNTVFAHEQVRLKRDVRLRGHRLDGSVKSDALVPVKRAVCDALGYIDAFEYQSLRHVTDLQRISQTTQVSTTASPPTALASSEKTVATSGSADAGVTSNGSGITNLAGYTISYGTNPTS
jgi:hypothetical protein